MHCVLKNIAASQFTGIREHWAKKNDSVFTFIRERRTVSCFVLILPCSALIVPCSALILPCSVF